jgi:DNA polymerase III delta subunit
MHPYAVFKKLEKITKFNEEQLKQGLADVLQAELDIKTGNKKDDMAVELLIMKIMKLKMAK